MATAAEGPLQMDRARALVNLLDAFPGELRLHVMFLEAADSYRLNKHLVRKWLNLDAIVCAVVFA